MKSEPVLDALDEFAADVRGFLACCDEAQGSERERLVATSRSLARLYALAWSLNDSGENGEDEVDIEQLDSELVRGRVAVVFPGLGLYRTVEISSSVDASDSMMYGDAIDDLCDIYIDLHAGLEHFRLGRRVLARESWSFSFRTHWGEHLVEVLRILHARLTSNDVSSTP